MAKSYFHDGADWRELVKGEQGERGPVGPRGPQGPAIDIETGLPISVDTSVGTRVFVGDTMIHGDTDWRDVTSLITPAPTLGTMRIRRYGDTIEVVTDSLSVPTSGSAIIATLPTGFRPQGNKTFRAHPYWASDSEEVGRIAFDGRFQFRLLSAGNQFTVTLIYTTKNAWPNSLPGTPV